MKTMTDLQQSPKAKNENNACTVYAFASAFGLDFETAHTEVKGRFKRPDKQGARTFYIVEAMKAMQEKEEVVNSHKVVRIIEKPTQNYKCYGQIVPRRLRISSFAAAHPKGTFFLLINKHALVLKDGVFVDNLSKSRPSSLLDYAYEIQEVK